MDQQAMKMAAAEAALNFITEPGVIGIGTGSTANCFIDVLSRKRELVTATVASSEVSADRLRANGFEVLSLNEVSGLNLYVDGADEFNTHKHLIKGGGGALTREKIVAAASKKFICVVDQTKRVDVLGEFPLPIEVIPMATELVARFMAARGGDVKLRDGFITDNGNPILDVHGLKITDPVSLEQDLNHLPGVVCNGLFALRPADVVLLANSDGVEEIR